jgi:uncharacterized membrane protein
MRGRLLEEQTSLKHLTANKIEEILSLVSMKAIVVLVLVLVLVIFVFSYIPLPLFVGIVFISSHVLGFPPGPWLGLNGNGISITSEC